MDLVIFTKKAGGFNQISIDEFNNIPSAKRIEMIFNKELKFLNTAGDKVSTKEALKIIRDHN